MASGGYQEFLAQLDPLQAEAISYLDSLFLSVEGVSRKMRYNLPFYDYNKWISYINPIGTGRLELCFLDGKQMFAHFPELDMKGRKMVSGLLITVNQNLPHILILDMIKHAVSLKS